MKLHLGCGQTYLKGYTNIDFPSSKHTVQTKSVADEYADITKLDYPASSVDEVRLHHVFEHFTRPVACALLVGWREWLKVGGVLHIEVPDFERTARAILNPLTNENLKCVGLRHIFGSNEEDWAVHYEGWAPKRMSGLLTTLGYEVTQIKKENWKGLYNFALFAKKSEQVLSKAEQQSSVKNFLNKFLVDPADEQSLLEVWMGQYNKQLNQIWPKNRK